MVHVVILIVRRSLIIILNGHRRRFLLQLADSLLRIHKVELLLPAIDQIESAALQFVHLIFLMFNIKYKF